MNMSHVQTGIFINIKTTMRGIILNYKESGNHAQAQVVYMDGTILTDIAALSFPYDALNTPADVKAGAIAAAQAYATTNSYTMSEGIFCAWDEEVNAIAESALSLSIQTSTGAVGTQVSATQDAWVSIAGQVSTTASIAGNAAGDLIVEVAPTNSATAGDWVEKGRIGNSQNLSLAITLQSVQIVKGQVFAFVPMGYYIKARSSGSGTVAYTLNTVRKILI